MTSEAGEEERNKALLRRAFEATERGDGRPFVELLDGDVRWSIIGSTPWSGTYDGRAAVLRDLLGPLTRALGGVNRVRAERLVAEGPVVVVEARNLSRTTAGVPYPNRYCWVMTLRAGRVVDIVEYADTALIERALGRPDSARG